MNPRLVHIDTWLLEFLRIASDKSGIPVNEIIRLGCCSYIIEFAKAAGYKPSIDSQAAFLKMKGAPTKENIRRIIDLFQHEARIAASFRIKTGAILTRVPEDNKKHLRQPRSKASKASAR